MSEILEVRRSRPIAALQAIFCAVLLALALFSIVQLWDSEGPRDRFLASGFFTVILAVYLWYAIQQVLDRAPLVVIGRDGLRLPGTLPHAIPWSGIRSASHPGGLFGRHRIDIDIDMETRARAKVGMRFLGDPIAGRPGSTTGISIVTKALDTKAADIFAAIKRYWPPPEAESGS